MSTKTLLDAATFFLTPVNELRSEQATVAGALLSAKQYNGVNAAVLTDEPTHRDDLTKVEQEQYFRVLRRFSPIAPVDRIVVNLILPDNHLVIDFSTGATSQSTTLAIPDVTLQPVIVDILLPEKDTTYDILCNLQDRIESELTDTNKPWNLKVHSSDDLHEDLMDLVGDPETPNASWFDVHYYKDRLEILLHVPDSTTVKRLTVFDLADAVRNAGV